MAIPSCALPFVPDTTDLGRLAEAAERCQGHELYSDAIRTVFGQGGPVARSRWRVSELRQAAGLLG